MMNPVLGTRGRAVNKTVPLLLWSLYSRLVGRHRINQIKYVKNCKCNEEIKVRWWWVTLSGWERLEEVSSLVRMFPEGIFMEVTFESALGWWEGNSHVEKWGGDSKWKNSEVISELMRLGEADLTAEVLLPWLGVGVGKVISEAF